jgi:hypothetical protein
MQNNNINKEKRQKIKKIYQNFLIKLKKLNDQRFKNINQSIENVEEKKANEIKNKFKI